MKPPKAATPAPQPLYDLDKGVVRVPIDRALWDEFQTALVDYEAAFGAMPTKEELEKARRDIDLWHRTGDWFIAFQDKHCRVLHRLETALLEAAKRG